MKTILATITAILGAMAFAFINGKKSEKNKQNNERNKRNLDKVKRARKIRTNTSKLNDTELNSTYGKLLSDNIDG